MRPIIGITSPVSDGFYTIRPEYADAVFKAGGLPFMLPYTDNAASTAEAVAGILFTGGGDILPKFYGEEARPEISGICESRDIFELALCREAIARNIPILCICRGMQLLNVCMGGTIEQHIENHRYDRSQKYLHEIEISKTSSLHTILGESARVNSRHHQALADIAPGIAVSARSGDGVIEAIEIPGRRFAIGVQWHPEDMAAFDRSQLKLFEDFVRAAAG